MNIRSTRKYTAALIGASAILAIQCSRSSPSAPSSAVIAPPSGSNLVGDSTNSAPEAGKVKICKVGNVDGTYNFTVVSGNPSVAPQGYTVRHGECRVVAENPPFSPQAQVSVTETSAGLQSASVERCEGFAGAPCSPIGSSSFSNGGTVAFLNNPDANSGATITFTNNVPPPELVAQFVIGDVEPHAIDDIVNFWGAQWWKNNQMSGFVSDGVASFKGFATRSDNVCGGTWVSQPGNSSDPPATIPSTISIIITDTVVKNGPDISGNIKQIVTVAQDGGYGPNPGHRGNGPVVSIVCQ